MNPSKIEAKVAKTNRKKSVMSFIRFDLTPTLYITRELRIRSVKTKQYQFS
jgi:hypothetical protein